MELDQTTLDKPQPALKVGAARLVEKRPRSHRATKIVPLTREHLDGRSNAAKQFDAIAQGIAQDLGGVAQLSTVQKHLVEAFAGAAINVNDLNARLLLGEQVDIVEHSQAISTLVRVATRIGVYRLTRDVTPSVQDYVEHLNEREAAE